MFDKILTQSFNMISIAEVGYKIVRKLFSKGSEFIKKRKRQEED